MVDEYVAVDDAAKELGISRGSAWRWLKRHKLKTYRAMGDRRTLIRRADLATLREPLPITGVPIVSGTRTANQSLPVHVTVTTDTETPSPPVAPKRAGTGEDGPR